VKVAVLFCGAGGDSEGFRQAGFEIIFGIDNNENACKTFRHNFPEATVVCEDINYFDERYLLGTDCDVIIGSPPCKEFSKGNVKRTFDTSLIGRFLEIVGRLDPQYYVMENVPDVQDAINNLYGDFAGKFPTQLKLDAYDFGCATSRERLFSGVFPKKVKEAKIKRAVKDVINCEMSGYQQPFKDTVYRKIDPNKPLFTICSQRIGNERYLLPNGRSLEVSELATIQGFPPWFIFPCSRSEAQRQIGNAVCPPVAKAIADAILEAAR